MNTLSCKAIALNSQGRTPRNAYCLRRSPGSSDSISNAFPLFVMLRIFSRGGKRKRFHEYGPTEVPKNDPLVVRFNRYCELSCSSVHPMGRSDAALISSYTTALSRTVGPMTRYERVFRAEMRESKSFCWMMNMGRYLAGDDRIDNSCNRIALCVKSGSCNSIPASVNGLPGPFLDLLESILLQMTSRTLVHLLRGDDISAPGTNIVRARMIRSPFVHHALE